MVTETKKKNWFRKHWILTLILGILLLMIIFCAFDYKTERFSSKTEKFNHKTEDLFNKIDLKEDIEKISLSTSYVPKISALTFQNNTLFVEYASFENENSGIFDEQQKVSEKIASYFETNKIQVPNEVLFKVNGITNENTMFFPVFDTKLNWNETVKMANFELEYSSWLANVNSTKKIK